MKKRRFKIVPKEHGSEFKPSTLGVDGNMQEISELAFELESKHVSSPLEEEPWCMMSVQDHMSLNHFTEDDDSTVATGNSSVNTLKIWQNASNDTAKRAPYRNKLKFETEFREYEGGSFWDCKLDSEASASLMSLTLKDTAQIKRSQNVNTFDQKFVSTNPFTRNGAALDEYKEKSLEDRIQTALEMYFDDIEKNYPLDKVETASIDHLIRMKPLEVPKMEEKKSLLSRVYKKLFIKTDLQGKYSSLQSAFVGLGQQFNSGSLSISEACKALSAVRVRSILQYMVVQDAVSKKSSLDELCVDRVPIFHFMLAKAVKYDNSDPKLLIKKSRKMKKSTKQKSEKNTAGDEKKRSQKVDIAMETPEVENEEDDYANDPAYQPSMWHRFISIFTNKDNSDSLTVPTRQKIQNILEIILEFYPDALNRPNEETGQYPLHVAAANGDMRLLKWLLSIYADIHQLSAFDHMTPIEYAVKNHHIDVCIELIRQGAYYDMVMIEKDSGNIRDKLFHKTLMSGKDSGLHDITNIRKEKPRYDHLGLCANKEFPGYTLLHICAHFNYIAFGLFLLRIGANKFVRNKKNLIASEVAHQHKNFLFCEVVDKFSVEKPSDDIVLEYHIQKYQEQHRLTDVEFIERHQYPETNRATAKTNKKPRKRGKRQAAKKKKEGNVEQVQITDFED